MPATAARALARPAVVDDDDVAELDAGAARAAERPAAGDDAAAEARAEREHHEVVDAAARAGTPLADRGGVRVVVEPVAQPEALRHVVAEREVAERQVHALDDDARDLVDRRRHPEAERCDLVVEQLRHRRFELSNDRGLGILRRRTLVPPDDRAVPRYDPGQDLRPAEVHPDRVTAVHPQWVP